MIVELALAVGLVRVQVAADEFSLVLSRPAVPPGSALVELVNYGEDDHDLRLRRIGSATTRTWRLETVGPGGHEVLEAMLRSGRYRLWCSLAGHRARGMAATLVVRVRG